MTTTVAIARRRSVIDLRASAIRGSSLVVQQVVEGRVTDQEEDQIVEAEQPKPCTEAPVVRATRGEQVLARTGRRDHQWDQQREQDQRREQVSRARHRRDRGDQRPGGGQADVGEQQDEGEGQQPGGRVEEEQREDRHHDQLEDDQVDHERARLGREEGRSIDGGEPDQVEPALLALRHKEAVYRAQRPEQERRDPHPGRELPVELLAVEPEAEDDEGADGEEHHGGQRAQRAKLDPQVLAEKGRERRHPSSRTKSEASVAAPRSWLTTSRVRPSPAAIKGATRRRASGSRWASGSSRSSRSGSCSTARQMSIRCLIPAESSATRSRARAVMPTASSRSSVRGPASPASSPWSAAASSRF